MSSRSPHTLRDYFDAIRHRDVEQAGRSVILDAGYACEYVHAGRRAVRHFTNAVWIKRLPKRTADL